MKRTAALVLAAMLILSFPTACRNKNDPVLPMPSDLPETAEIAPGALRLAVPEKA